jgi:hypothetical protein
MPCRRVSRWLALCLVPLLAATLHAAAKNHAVILGKAQTVKWYVDADEEKAENIRVRPLLVDGKLKEYTSGAVHDVTDRVFVIRRAYRVNDNLPQEEGKLSRWRWQLGGWLQVDRVSGRVAALNLPEFDPYYSLAAWYRDYAAYCGVSDDGSKLTALVMQLGRRKPVLKKSLGEAGDGETPDANCDAPLWQRQPARVTFQPTDAAKVTYAVHGRSVDLVSEEESEAGP